MATSKKASEKPDESREPTSLAEAASAAVTHIGDPSQDAFEGMENLNKVKFVGMSMDSLDDLPKIGTEMTFVVRARCVGTGEEEMRDGHVRHFAKMDVQSVVVQDD